MKKLIFSIYLALATGVGAAQAGANLIGGDPAAGKEKSAPCAACHGAQGIGTAPNYPVLAGQHAGYINKQLQDYKSGARENAIMAGMAAPLSEQDMADLGAYFASQSPRRGSADADLVELGQKIYRAGNTKTSVPACMSCHSPAGAGNAAAHFPALSGQYAAYTAQTLHDFKTGARANDAGEMMRTIATKMSAQEIAAVAEYLSGLH